MFSIKIYRKHFKKILKKCENLISYVILRSPGYVLRRAYHSCDILAKNVYPEVSHEKMSDHPNLGIVCKLTGQLATTQ